MTSAADDLPDDPLDALHQDRGRAFERQDPCAGLCTVASVDRDGLPEARTLVLRAVAERFAVFVNATSPKWQALVETPVSVVVWLPTCNVQYRMTCTTEPVAQTLVHESWQQRPHPPKRMDWYYSKVRAQSSPVESRSKLLGELDNLDVPHPLVAPESARGLYLLTDRVERLDLGQENGIHDRRLYRRVGQSWELTVLTP